MRDHLPHPCLWILRFNLEDPQRRTGPRRCRHPRAQETDVPHLLVPRQLDVGHGLTPPHPPVLETRGFPLSLRREAEPRARSPLVSDVSWEGGVHSDPLIRSPLRQCVWTVASTSLDSALGQSPPAPRQCVWTVSSSPPAVCVDSLPHPPDSVCGQFPPPPDSVDSLLHPLDSVCGQSLPSPRQCGQSPPPP